MKNKMICHRCGGTKMEEQVTDLPFKLDTHKILVIRGIPAGICSSCGEIVLADGILQKIDKIIDRVKDVDCDLEVVRFAACR